MMWKNHKNSATEAALQITSAEYCRIGLCGSHPIYLNKQCVSLMLNVVILEGMMFRLRVVLVFEWLHSGALVSSHSPKTSKVNRKV